MSAAGLIAAVRSTDAGSSVSAIRRHMQCSKGRVIRSRKHAKGGNQLGDGILARKEIAADRGSKISVNRKIVPLNHVSDHACSDHLAFRYGIHLLLTKMAAKPRVPAPTIPSRSGLCGTRAHGPSKHRRSVKSGSVRGLGVKFPGPTRQRRAVRPRGAEGPQRFQYPTTCCTAAHRGFVPKAVVSNRSKVNPHSITSSASASSVGGIARPRDSAVFMLMTSSNLVG